MIIVRYLDKEGNEKHAGAKEDHKFFELSGDILGEYELTDREAQIHKQLAPIVPPIIFGIGLNYGQHADETGMAHPEFPILFLKGPNAVQNPDDPIVIPGGESKSEEVDYECELGVVIGKPCKDVEREEALEYVLGYTCANDVSARDWQIKWGGSQWCRGKGFDTFAPLGPCIVTTEDVPDPNSLRIRTVLNGETMQDSNTSDMIFDVRELISFLSKSTTLLPGSVIMTGTPQGVGMARKPPVYLKEGDSVTIIIEKIGALTNPIIQSDR